MRTLTPNEINQVAGSDISIQKITSRGIDILVTGSSRFVSAGTYGGYRLNVILYADKICDLYDNILKYDFSGTIFHNGNSLTAVPVQDGHIYQFLFNEG